jgi:hypothetical protein
MVGDSQGRITVKSRNAIDRTAWARAAGLALALFAGAARPDVALLNERIREEIQALDAFARQRPAAAAGGAAFERAGSWMLYGHLGPLRFHSQLDSSSPELRFGLGRGSSGPAPGGRANVGLYRRFH